jgi:hypothetical protein
MEDNEGAGRGALHKEDPLTGTLDDGSVVGLRRRGDGAGWGSSARRRRAETVSVMGAGMGIEER